MATLQNNPMEYDKSKFDLGYFFTHKKQDTWKSLKYGLTFCLILGICYLVYRGAEALFPKPPKQENIVTVQSGGKATFIQQGKKNWFTLFVEPYIGMRIDTEKEGRGEIGTRLGCRIEF